MKEKRSGEKNMPLERKKKQRRRILCCLIKMGQEK